MKKVLSILLILMVLFMASCSDDKNTPNSNGKDDDKEQIDEQLIGKWKVEYSKTITPATYNKETGKPEYNENANIKEYFGNWGEPNVIPESGMFDVNEFEIEITIDKKIISSIGGGNSKTISYKIEDGLLLSRLFTENIADIYLPIRYYKYTVSKDELNIEFIGIEEGYTWSPFYVLSKYSKK